MFLVFGAVIVFGIKCRYEYYIGEIKFFFFASFDKFYPPSYVRIKSDVLGKGRLYKCKKPF